MHNISLNYKQDPRYLVNMADNINYGISIATASTVQPDKEKYINYLTCHRCDEKEHYVNEIENATG